MLAAYRYQYIVSGVQDERFQKILGGMVNKAQMKRIGEALAPIVGWGWTPGPGRRPGPGPGAARDHAASFSPQPAHPAAVLGRQEPPGSSSW